MIAFKALGPPKRGALRLLALLAHIRLGCKDLLGANALAYLPT